MMMGRAGTFNMAGPGCPINAMGIWSADAMKPAGLNDGGDGNNPRRNGHVACALFRQGAAFSHSGKTIS
jgi:hypothetical protein